MARLTFNISISVDGYVAGPDQGPEHPLGVGGLALHEWVFPTRFFRAMAEGADNGETGVDNDQAARWHHNVGATIMGRNMFGQMRGPWTDQSWTGWWGDNPPYHTPVFVLTHHPRESVSMQGGTTFRFVTDGPETALERAFEAAEGKDVAIAGGARTAQQYLRFGLIDLMGLHVVPLLLGRGERLFDNLDGGPTGYECVEVVASQAAAHYTYVRRSTDGS